jgi:hypothetical protein
MFLHMARFHPEFHTLHIYILHSQANCVHPLTIDGDKPKQKRQREKEHTAQASLETQLAACKARI